ncbi:uncharacterized protein PGTG_13007 [Puccinia graminis f. sp. tritici CRL 75-36-700-3]|uniref:Uncharacterized protein n=1 Tax=Puccinia graminis f. sp. tritici (strain CRL 75-36-700-3 / race SCCL) TaxID=418459 RepID=E3KQQ0_PUCGT|nr:uncharacterized protein PGTG_13007 [Puccinia graminis f. sp. tritici CRL 75-36-700-3]EFP86625.1 hypothetical protein PGTG_13007 [Puccinia graminis f. sp. tritici CRL 75-36-700-3]
MSSLVSGPLALFQDLFFRQSCSCQSRLSAAIRIVKIGLAVQKLSASKVNTRIFAYLVSGALYRVTCSFSSIKLSSFWVILFYTLRGVYCGGLRTKKSINRDRMADNEVGAAMVKIKPQNKSLAFNGSNIECFLSQYQLAARLDGASEKDMAQQLGFFIAKDELLDVVETLEGYEPPDWPKLKASMIAYWGNVDTAKFTSRDLESLVEEWKSKGGISSVVDYQEFRKTWEPIQSYLLAKAHIDSVEEIHKWYYQSFSTGVQERIRDQLIRDKTMITTLDKRFKLPTFEVLKNAVEEVMKGQTALTFEDSRSTVPVPSTLFKDSNDVMKKMEADRRPKEVSDASKPPATIDEISKMLQSFEQRLKKELSTPQASQTTPSGTRPPMVCYYCHYEGHGTGRCQKLQEDKENKLVEQQGNNFFLPNGALIPFDRTQPIRHVVASYQPPIPSASFVSTEFKTSCGTLQPW